MRIFKEGDDLPLTKVFVHGRPMHTLNHFINMGRIQTFSSIAYLIKVF